MDPLLVTSSRSDNAAFLVEAVVEHLQADLGRPVRLDGTGDWRSREARLLAGQVGVGFVCSIPYVENADRLEVLAAPVMAAERYRGRPVYFSDVLVRRASPFRTFEDLRGCRWAYNEPDSHSGCNVTRYYLASTGRACGFFGEVVETGAHETSLAQLLRGEVDATALDSVVLELELARRPDLSRRLRRVHTFGPSAGPPVVASRLLPGEERKRIREALLRFPAGHEAARRYGLRRFEAVQDGFYDSIREMARRAAEVVWR